MEPKKSTDVTSTTTDDKPAPVMPKGFNFTKTEPAKPAPEMPKGFAFKPTTGGFDFAAAASSLKNEPDTTSVPSSDSSPAAIPSGFAFTFNKDSISKPSPSVAKSPGKLTSVSAVKQPSNVLSPKSPEITTDGMYVNKDGDDDHIHFEPIISMPDEVAIVTGEEDDHVLFDQRAKLFRFDKKEWKERGLGNVKLLWNQTTNKCRLLMRREQILKICCHHYITEDLELKLMPNTENKAWIWYAMDFTEEPQMIQFAIKFRNADFAANFRDAFEDAKEKSLGNVGDTQSPPKPSSKVSQVDGDVVFVKEEKATPEQVKKARQYKLPDHFYLYENRSPCPGCRGCTDDMPDFTTQTGTGM